MPAASTRRSSAATPSACRSTTVLMPRAASVEKSSPSGCAPRKYVSLMRPKLSIETREATTLPAGVDSAEPIAGDMVTNAARTHADRDLLFQRTGHLGRNQQR